MATINWMGAVRDVDLEHNSMYIALFRRPLFRRRPALRIAMSRPKLFWPAASSKQISAIAATASRIAI
jgi:hypothetical protein